MIEWIEKAAELLASDPDVDDEDVANALIAAGCGEDLANVILEYLPSILATSKLKEMGVVRDQRIGRFLTNGRSVQFEADEDPVWKAIEGFVASLDQKGREHFEVIATRSAELDAVNNATEQGVDMEGAVMSTAVLYALPPDSDLLPESVRKRQGSSWWKFW